MFSKMLSEESIKLAKNVAKEVNEKKPAKRLEFIEMLVCLFLLANSEVKRFRRNSPTNINYIS